MAINNSSKTFGDRLGGNANHSNDKDFEKAEFWINVGYSVESEDPETSEMKHTFISTPKGLPLDTQEKLKTTSGNTSFVNQRHAQNDLHDQLMDVAKTMDPGETRIIQLEVQIRRVRGEAAPTKPSENPFRKRLTLVD